MFVLGDQATEQKLTFLLTKQSIKSFNHFSVDFSLVC